MLLNLESHIYPVHHYSRSLTNTIDKLLDGAQQVQIVLGDSAECIGRTAVLLQMLLLLLQRNYGTQMGLGRWPRWCVASTAITAAATATTAATEAEKLLQETGLLTLLQLLLLLLLHMLLLLLLQHLVGHRTKLRIDNRGTLTVDGLPQMRLQLNSLPNATGYVDVVAGPLVGRGVIVDGPIPHIVEILGHAVAALAAN